MPVVTDNQVLSLHTASGSPLYDFLPSNYADCSWGRALRDASRCSLAVPPLVDVDTLPDIVPWLHWLSVWDGDRDILLWTGPVQKVTANRRGLQLEAKDSGAYLSRLRNPMTKRWDAADPAWVAGELWDALLDQQNLNQRAIVRPDPEGDRFDYQVITDEQMLDQTISDLVNLGLRWTVVSGAPILGPLSLEPVATLDEDDFLGDGISFVRDGTATFNDVLVRGPDNLARARVDYYGQNLQTIANVDSMFGVSNVTRAAQAYVKHTGSVRTTLELGGATELHPDAPVHIDELMPSARFVIEAQGIRQLMSLTTVEVSRTSVKVTMEQVEEKLELGKEKAKPTVTLGKAAAL
jgi:hypothetical protein